MEPLDETITDRTFAAGPVVPDSLREHQQCSAALSPEQQLAGTTTANPIRGANCALRLPAQYQSGMERADQRHLRSGRSLPRAEWLPASGLVTDVLWPV